MLSMMSRCNIAWLMWCVSRARRPRLGFEQLRSKGFFAAFSSSNLTPPRAPHPLASVFFPQGRRSVFTREARFPLAGRRPRALVPEALSGGPPCPEPAAWPPRVPGSSIPARRKKGTPRPAGAFSPAPPAPGGGAHRAGGG